MTAGSPPDEPATKRARTGGKATTICRFRVKDQAGDELLGQPSAWDDDGCPTQALPLLQQDLYGGDLSVASEPVQIAKLLAPVDPVAIICIGLNYGKHAAESGMPVPTNPVVFMKAVSTLQHPGEPIEIPEIESKVDWEVELAVVIGKRCKNAKEADALKFVAGYTVANDVSGREWQLEKGGGQWCFGKSFDTFTPLGPVLVTPDLVTDPQNLEVKTTVGSQVMQSSSTSDMIFPVAKIIEFLSQGTTLLPGTVILTGTPSGVGLGCKPQRWLKPGEVVTVEIAQIGKLTNHVRLAGQQQPSCCPPGSLAYLEASHEPAGSVITEGGVDMYVNKPRGTELLTNAIILFPDIWGWNGGRIRAVADEFASHHMVVIPKILNPVREGGTDGDAMSPTSAFDMDWIKQFPWSVQKPKVDSVLSYVRAQGVTKIAVFGFCYGGHPACWASSENDDIMCGVVFHPSMQLEQFAFGGDFQKLIRSVQAPFFIAPAGNDLPMYAEEGEFGASLKASSKGSECIIKPYHEMTHGWSVRGNLSDPATRRDVELVMKDAANFVAKHFGASP